MKKVIRTHERTIPYTVKKSTRAKHVRISVNCDGAVLVTRPACVPFERIEEIVARKFGWIVGKIDFFKKFATVRRRSVAEYRKQRKSALALVQSRIEHFNQQYGFTIGQISIRNQRTRWGSCSKRGNLNFNHRIVGLAPELVDYIVVHELCHLAELNHSKQFWKLVEQTMPKYNELRRALKQNSL
ncbi:MAG: M48 family metallopeptidase [Patescibacteria group bacterium]